MQNLFSISMSLPESLRALSHAFLRRFEPRVQGTLITDALAGCTKNQESDPPIQRALDEETLSLFEEWKSRNPNLSTSHTPRTATYHRRARHNGLELKPSNVSFPDSLIVIGREDIWSAAQIESIFNIEIHSKGVRRRFTLLKIHHFEEMTAEDTPSDIYRRFDGVGRVVYVDGDMNKKEVIPMSSALSNFAMTEGVFPRVKRKHAHVLPLFRVSEIEIPALQYYANLVFVMGFWVRSPEARSSLLCTR